tara:strand:+ start:1569 stop:2141 length:573 start_codon:yes stop_codon:yes gene_type:complete
MSSIDNFLTQEWLNKQDYETLSEIAEMLYCTHTIKLSEWNEMTEEDVNERCEEWGVEKGNNIYHTRNRLRAANDDEETEESEESSDGSGDSSDETMPELEDLYEDIKVDNNGWPWGKGRAKEEDKEFWVRLELRFRDEPERLTYDELMDLVWKRSIIPDDGRDAEAQYEIMDLIEDIRVFNESFKNTVHI